MLKFRKLLLKVTHTEQGFTLFEVLIGILIASAFVAVAMQALVIATMFRVKAQEKEIASQLIQQDKEAVEYAASTYGIVSTDYQTSSKCLATTYANGYAKAVFSNLFPKPENTHLLAGNQGKELAIERIEQSASSVAPYKILRVKYIVSESKYTTVAEKEANAIAIDYLEVIPDVALRCP